ncbi:SgrR family transcriptional regulator [Pantoea eucrina]|uniref:SgrR family transcriptional regulator n=1 Tax=Pantoea eucrina TaxID=472693 RepID=UPI00080F4316|nr:SgrR family transcriptional regulator [Pantoea eucrina]
MRELHRVSQFQRLWHASQGETQRLSVAMLAKRCFCSERHARTLLKKWQQAGWIRWESQPGRGKQGELQFLITPEALRQQLLNRQLLAGEPVQMLQTLDLPPERLLQLLQPLMGGHWQDRTPVLRIPYYRTLAFPAPLQPLGRAEQHLARQIFSGLTRVENNRVRGDLAHHWQHDSSGLNWSFWLRPQLSWHNGDPMYAAQLAAVLQQIIRSASGRVLLASVAQIDAPHPLTLRIRLHQPDYWLPQRLAHQFCLLPHPDSPQTGSGPWQLMQFTPTLLRLESYARWHLQRALIQRIEYWITPTLFMPEQGNSCRHPVQIAIGNADELQQLRPVDRSISRGFCYLATRPSLRFSAAQARTLIALIQRSDVIRQLPLAEGLITPSQWLLPGWPVPQTGTEPVALPARLTLHYHLPVELHVMAEALVRLLASHGCELTCVFHEVKSWNSEQDLTAADIVMGDRLIGDAPQFTLLNWLEQDRLWQPLRDSFRQSLQQIACEPDDGVRSSAVQQLFHTLMSEGYLLPLFNYRYQVLAPPGVEGVHLTALGWFDFTRAWIPPPVPCPVQSAPDAVP